MIIRDIQGFANLALDRIVPEFSKLKVPNSGFYLNLGAGNKHIPGCRELDLPEWNAEEDIIPYDDETVVVVHAYHFLEHLANPIFVLSEIERVLKPGGVANIGVPYYSSQCAYQDLNHKTFWCEETWRNLFSNPYYGDREWKLKVGFNAIFGIVERNLMLFTQLIKI
jgi:SAM-dependent methyltransferase